MLVVGCLREAAPSKSSARARTQLASKRNRDLDSYTACSHLHMRQFFSILALARTPLKRLCNLRMNSAAAIALLTHVYFSRRTLLRSGMELEHSWKTLWNGAVPVLCATVNKS
jgi:hypothetical protein